MLSKLINRIDFAFLVSILASLCGLWAFVYNIIVNLTSNGGMQMTLALSICHYIITIYIIALLYICFHKSIALAEEEKKEHKIADFVISIFLRTWPYVIIISLIIVCLDLINLSEGLYLGISLGVLLLCFLYCLVRLSVLRNLKYILTYLFSSAMGCIGYFAFLIILTNASMRITVNTDKEYYTHLDREIILTIDAHGYLVKPFFRVVEPYGFFKEVGNFGDCYWIPLSSMEHYTWDPIIWVEYRNHLFQDNRVLSRFMAKDYMCKDIYYKKLR